MKKLLFILATLCSLTANAVSEVLNVIFTVDIVHPGGSGNSQPKAPIRPPQATLDGHVLTFTSDHADYTLTLFSEDGDEAYTVFVPYDVDVVMFPATLTGTYGIQLDFGGSYVFVSEIFL